VPAESVLAAPPLPFPGRAAAFPGRAAAFPGPYLNTAAIRRV
jgi:hypothetical protein